MGQGGFILEAQTNAISVTMGAQGRVQFTNVFPDDGFVTEWVVAGDATARTITLPTPSGRTEGALSYNYTVYWGDGLSSTVTSYNDANRAHTYAVDGTYQIRIQGTMEGWSINNGTDKLKIRKVINWGSSAGGFNGFKYLQYGFYGCTNLNYIPPPDQSLTGGIIPASGTGCLFQGFNALFYNCSSLTSIPSEQMFSAHPNAEAFSYVFRGTGISQIPSYLFEFNTAATTFQHAFSYCPSLGELPVYLFDNNPNVTTFGSLCESDGNLYVIPPSLFYNNTACLSWYNAFLYTSKLQHYQNVFFDVGGESTRFAGQSVDFTNCFYRTTFTGYQGTAEALWTCTFNTVTSTNCYKGAGNSLTSLTNYASIPAGW